MTVSEATAEQIDRLDTPALVRRAQDGSVQAFIELVERFEGRLYNFLLRRTATPADAEDLTQETLVKAWLHLDRYRPQWQFSTWLFTIARRAAVSQIRRERRRDAAPLLHEPAGAADPSRRAVQREACSRIWDAADRLLPDAQRSALWLRYAEDLPIREIARILGKSQVGVRVLLFRARQALAEDHGVRRDIGAGSRAAAPDEPACMNDVVPGEVSCRG